MTAEGQQQRKLVEVPDALRGFGRWQHQGEAGSRWLAALPDTVVEWCDRWNLKVDGRPMHGYNSLVVPVSRGSEPLALKVTWPDRHMEEQVLALRLWDGHGAVRLVDADTAAGVMLMRRLDHTRSLRDVPLEEAVPVIGTVLRRLAVEPPHGLRTTGAIAAQHRRELAAQWEDLGRPMPRRTLDRGLELAGELSRDDYSVLVNNDLHYEQVLRTWDEDWAVVDPLIVSGVLEFQVAPLLWSRFDELGSSRVEWCIDALADAADLDRDRARRWALLRAVEYWLWGLKASLTEDPVRCRHITEALMCPRGVPVAVSIRWARGPRRAEEAGDTDP
ncbi:aminoglycoside phosphotransferase family protein [Streptomyces sp. TRM68367]|uniref:aminoglycoside phosphotransferase family protein n=1 Tax=Streptomyces sp. TRM68367 TaxID=2758415 RepID=UPI00165ADA6C|nr:aminoglycoside phosphotransferase family protein [Streptomyces sp. TRM68367]MBC9729365.1 kinase [Streptomyces sp. TRM68367]